MFDTLFKKITKDTLVLTANSRLARYLQFAFEQYQQPKKTVWETPRILPLQSWLELQFHRENKTGALLLKSFQEECVWQEIIQNSALAPDLLQPTQLTKLVKQAFEYLTLWQVPPTELHPFQTQLNVQYLTEWIFQFQKKCEQKNWIVHALLPQKIQSCDAKKIILIGFDDLNPSLQSLFSHLETKIKIETETLTENTIDKKQIILENTDTEIKTMAQWIKAQWKKNPNGKLGCVIPELRKIRSKVQRIFTEVFCIEQIIPGIPAENMPFNISAGLSLTQYHMIQVALTVLNWCQTDLPIENLAAILQSPYLCLNEDEKNQGAKIDALLREQNKLLVSMADLCSMMPLRWRTLIKIYREKKSMALPPSQWAQHFINLLKAIEWPSHRTQNSAEFQVLERFKKVLLEFSQLDFIFKKINFRRALQLLTTLTQQTIFQTKSHNEPIQIMGALEASGILFDALWVMGLHDGIWPPPTKPHPFIPYSIQQRYEMPHATSKRELQFCKHMTERLENAAKIVIFSSPKKEGDQHFFPSPLIQHIPMINDSDVNGWTFLLSDELSLSEKIFQSRQAETFDDHRAKNILASSTIHGGSNILKLQALCPFRSFATIRLKARALKKPALGISAITKGILIHQILFGLWGEIKDQAQLLALTDEALNILIKKYIEQALLDMNHAVQEPHHHYFFAVEKKRLQKIIKEWLTFEKTRPYFRVIERETECHLHINQLPIKIRLDRIDQLKDGSLFLMDYKTGLNTILGWFQERLADPQLPLYAVFLDNAQQPCSGISFAEIRSGAMKLKGVMHEEHEYTKNMVSGLIPIDRVKNSDDIYSWSKLLKAWKKSLEKLSNDFCHGIANVDPIEPAVCNTCDLKAVCRYEAGSDL